jgi:hypothetical protein
VTRGEYVVTFKGGPLGGETRVLPELLPRFRVPVFPRNHAWWKPADSPTMLPGFNEATYEPDKFTLRQMGVRTWSVDYVWLDPSEYLQQHNQVLKAQLAEANAKLEEEGKLREAVKVIKEILS